MRIRKNLVRVPSESGTHSCQLNQSPWDVPTTFSSSATVPPFFQVQENESFLQNKALGSVALLNISLAGRDKNGCVHFEEQEKEAVDIKYCAKTDENGNWICGLEAKKGETFCEFHLQNDIHPVTKKSTSNNIKQAKKSKSESNPYKSLYYYDGFGPTWGKRKIARELSKKGEDVVAMHLLPDSEMLEDLEEEDDMDEIEVDEDGEKRVRKRIKARSLKSLM